MAWKNAGAIPVAQWSGVNLLPAPTIRTALLTPTTLPLAAAMVTLFVSVAAPGHQADGHIGDLVMDVYFGDDEQQTKPLRLRPARVEPYCWTAGVTYTYLREGIFRPMVAAWFSGHNASWVAAHKDSIGVYRNLTSVQDVWLRGLLVLPPDMVPTRTNIRCGLREETRLPVGYTVSYAVSRVVAKGCRLENDDTASATCGSRESVLLFNSTGGAGHEMAYVFQEPGTYRIAVTLQNPLSAATVMKTVSALDEIRGLRVNLSAPDVGGGRQPFVLATGSNVTLLATYAAGTDVRCSWHVLPACGSCLVVAPAEGLRDAANTCVAWFLFPVAGAYSVTAEALNDLGQRHGASLTVPVIAQDRVKGLRVWARGPRWVAKVGARFVIGVTLEEGTNATVAYRVPGQQWTPVRPPHSGRGARNASLRFGEAGLQRVRVRAANLVSVERAVVTVHAFKRLPRSLVLGVVNCRGHRAMAAVFTRVSEGLGVLSDVGGEAPPVILLLHPGECAGETELPSSRIIMQGA
ncbi:uncharacterized protein LOC142570629 [Dermacentor variabilis]|uniref:uncharacterized protein LOC142570629 n=1 Tax=Dermacentor variabilis TaxID=34621 RepID=UPI003F5BBA3A